MGVTAPKREKKNGYVEVIKRSHFEGTARRGGRMRTAMFFVARLL